MNELFVVMVTQICLESLPISSSGHMMIASMLCQSLNGYALILPDHFDHLLHGPTVVILALFFFSSWWPMIRIMTKALSTSIFGKTMSDTQRLALGVYTKIIAWVLCADSVTVALYGVGKVLRKMSFNVPETMMLLGGLCVTMMLFIVLWYREKKDNDIQCAEYQSTVQDVIPDSDRGSTKEYYCHALILGLVQGLALIPGISRFASTFVVARLLGYSPRRAFATSFALFAPLVVAGFLFNGVREFVGNPESWELFTPSLIITMIIATVVAYGLFCFSYRLVLARRLWWFGLYMLVPISLLLWLMVG